jgi:hypothetical protein
LQARLDQLQDSAQPDVIFAESVGSCADMVATVLKPLLTLRDGNNAPASFSVFADSRLLRLRLLGESLPFNDDVVYIFDKQIEEANLVVINKIDLLAFPDRDELLGLAQQRFTGKILLAQNSRDPASLAHWLELIGSGRAALPAQSLEIDYQRYGEGEARLAWLDEEIILDVSEDQGREAVSYLLAAVQAALLRQQAAVGHLKTLIRAGEIEVKVSFPTLQDRDWQSLIPHLPGVKVNLMLNARVEMPAAALRQLVRRALDQTAAHCGVTYHESGVAYFHPSFPNPTHRIG